MVGLKTGKPGFCGRARLGQLHMPRPCADGTEVALCIGTIDFLQRWNLKKVAARAVKIFECNKATIPPDAYARRFCMHFEERFLPTKALEGAPTDVQGKDAADSDRLRPPEEACLIRHCKVDGVKVIE
uniref:PIPK domain-containing protein n=1 Tax=Alexandrium catenella TaxID=2925 RepID=A0A7S1WCS2_ALECA|mmetsp:Transcript_50614/g.135399  ORF Transcript_50614/g.135399 Transcript_50614/m.135399 type:complete len:128 (+) Transcript_50614:2-385(+)